MVRSTLSEGRPRRRGRVASQTYARLGHPASVILDVAEEVNADLIVVGNQGAEASKRFLLGGVPNKVSHHCPCHLLIVHTPSPANVRP